MGDSRNMRRNLLVVFSIVLVFCAFAATNVGTAEAAKAGFTANCYAIVNAVTIDGRWTTAGEWSDTNIYPLLSGLSGSFRLKWDFASDFSYIFQYYLVEIVGDTTSDAADSVVVCMAASPTLFGVPAGGTAPQTDCWKFEVNGTGSTATLTVYRGTGSGWAVFSGWSKPANFDAAVTVNASERSATPHKIVEFKMDAFAFSLNPETWVLVGAYDASQSAAGVQVWPTSSSINVPNDYGLLNTSMEAVPEGIGVAVMALVSTVAVGVGGRYLRRPRRRNSFA